MRADEKSRRTIALNKFWGKWGNARTSTRKLELLREYANERFMVCGDLAFRNRQMRTVFNQNKWKVIRINGHQKCQVCWDKETNRHHIIALANGGRNSKRNLILLCDMCHWAVHPWMDKPKEKELSMKETMERVAREA